MRVWPLLLIMIAALPLAAQGTKVKPAREPDWYQVELLIFANEDPEAAMSESWTLLPDLHYPQSALGLRRDTPRVAADRVLQLQELEQQTPAPTFDLAWDTPVDQLLSRYYQSLLWRQPSIELEPLFDLDVPVAYALLPVEQWEFAAERRRIDRNPGLQVLFHESWLQPMLEQAKSRPIIVDAGPLEGDFTTLQGSIRIYRGRYLHLETDLWLNTDGSYLASDWVMPPPPLPRAEEEQLAQPFEVLVTDNWLSLAESVEEPLEESAEESAEKSIAATIAALMEEYIEELLEEPAEEPIEEPLQAEPAGETDELSTVTSPGEADMDDLEPSPTPLSEEELQAFLDSPEYRWRHAVLLRQTRRMRGGELHYIDHPMFGLLIKVTRYKFEPFLDPTPNDSRSGRR
jgi:hypothetical protein